MKRGTLVISLDFELVWGLFDHITIVDKQTYFQNTLEVIPKIITLFQENNINATWATVGMLFNENWDEWHANIPKNIPSYTNVNLNPYLFGKTHRNLGLNQFFFAPNLIKSIQSVSGQEIGTHTYSHYYCLEKDQTKEEFEADIVQAIKIAGNFKIELKSLVFPRNQFNLEYLEICAQKGIETVRTNPNVWYWNTKQKETLAIKIARTADAYLPFKNKSYLANSISKDTVVCQQASRFLRPQSTIEIFNNSRLERIKNEMIQAAKNGEIYHLWWHPHNFGIDSENALKTLKSIIETFIFCKETYGMESLNMKQLRDSILF